MWQKFKNWLIKKLGGYTDEEYKKDWAIPKIPHIEPVHKDVVPIKARVSVGLRYLESPAIDIIGWAREQLLREITKEVSRFIEYEAKDDCLMDERIYSATLYVALGRKQCLL